MASSSEFAQRGEGMDGEGEGCMRGNAGYGGAMKNNFLEEGNDRPDQQQGRQKYRHGQAFHLITHVHEFVDDKVGFVQWKTDQTNTYQIDQYFVFLCWPKLRGTNLGTGWVRSG